MRAGGQGSMVLTRAGSKVKGQGSKGSLDVLHLAVWVGQCLCNRFAALWSNIVLVKAAGHQAEEDPRVKGQYLDLSQVKGQSSRLKGLT